eukprot:scaffold132746_cov31-Tisochrysis_lutea.AAC.1
MVIERFSPGLSFVGAVGRAFALLRVWDACWTIPSHGSMNAALLFGICVPHMQEFVFGRWSRCWAHSA